MSHVKDNGISSLLLLGCFEWSGRCDMLRSNIASEIITCGWRNIEIRARARGLSKWQLAWSLELNCLTMRKTKFTNSCDLLICMTASGCISVSSPLTENTCDAIRETHERASDLIQSRRDRTTVTRWSRRESWISWFSHLLHRWTLLLSWECWNLVGMPTMSRFCRLYRYFHLDIPATTQWEKNDASIRPRIDFEIMMSNSHRNSHRFECFSDPAV